MDSNVDNLSEGRPYDFPEVTIEAGSIQAHSARLKPVSYVCSGWANSRPVEMLLDSGCPVSILDITKYLSLPEDRKPELLSHPGGAACTPDNPARLTYSGLGGVSRPSMGCGVFDIELEGFATKHWVWVVDMEGLPRGAILGIDFIMDYDVLIHLSKCKVQVQGIDIPLHESTWTGEEAPVRCRETTVVKPNSAAVIPIALGGHFGTNSPAYMVKPMFDMLDKTGLLLGHCVVSPDEHGASRLAVTNTTNEDVHITKNQLLALAFEIESVAPLKAEKEQEEFEREFPMYAEHRKAFKPGPGVIPMAHIQGFPEESCGWPGSQVTSGTKKGGSDPILRSGESEFA